MALCFAMFMHEKSWEEKELLSTALLDIYTFFSQIDFGAYGGKLKMCFGDSLDYDSIPWEKWETILDAQQDATEQYWYT